MITLKVFGTPNTVSQSELERLMQELQGTVENIPSLCLKRSDVVIFFPTDRLVAGLGEEIVVFVEGVSESTKANTIQWLVIGCAKTTKKYFPHAVVKCTACTENPMHQHTLPAKVWEFPEELDDAMQNTRLEPHLKPVSKDKVPSHR